MGLAFKPTLSRSGQQPMRVEKSPNGVYSVKNVHSGDYEYFRGRPLPKVAAGNKTSRSEG
jgi:hypothetical protein